MAGTFSDFQANAWLTAVASSCWLALHFDHPEQAGAYASEYSGGGYGREVITFTAPSNRTMWNDTTIAFSGLVAGTVAYVAGWNAEFDGDMLWWSQLDTARNIADGQGIAFNVNDIALSL